MNKTVHFSYKMETQVLEAIFPHINSTFFGFETVEELINYELTSTDIYTDEDSINHNRVKRKEVRIFVHKSAESLQFGCFVCS